MTGTQPIRAGAGLAYGLLGLPLAFVALPLYVLLPNHYAREFGMPLATLGAVLLAARLFDAISDPLLGRLSDHLFGRSVRAVLGVGAVSAGVLALGLTSLFFPQVADPDALVAWALVALLITYTAYSQLSIAHQSWGAHLAGRHVAGDCGVCVDRLSGGGRHPAVPGGLCAVRRGAWHRPGPAQRPVGRRDCGRGR